MQEYNFTFNFKLDIDKELDVYLDELCEAGCNDSLVGCGQEGWLAMEFDRSADSMQQAIEAAILDVRSVIGKTNLIEIKYNDEEQRILG